MVTDDKQDMSPPSAVLLEKRKEETPPVPPRVHTEHIDFYVANKQLDNERFEADMKAELAAQTVIAADEPPDERWESWRAVARMAQDMWKKTDPSKLPPGVPHSCPRVLLHTERSKIHWDAVAANRTAQAVAHTLNIYDTSIPPDSPLMRTIIAHEMAHIVNGDITEKGYRESLGIRNREYKEVLANKRAAILHGTPRLYARLVSDACFKKYANPYRSKDTAHMAPKRLERSLKGWARTLEREYAADRETGEITDMGRAMEIYKESKELTMRLARFSSNIVNQTRR